MMRAEPGGMFFDTNIVVYSQDISQPFKKARAEEAMDAAMTSGRFVISTQVMQEFYAVALRKRWMPPAHAQNLLSRLAEHTVIAASADSVLRTAGSAPHALAAQVEGHGRTALGAERGSRLALRRGGRLPSGGRRRMHV